MRSLLTFLCALALYSAAAGTTAAPADPKTGAEYLTLAEAQPTDAVGKVEVTEFFAYYCPHCHALEPVLAAWVKKQGEKIVFRRVHVAHNPAVIAQQRLYYTLEAMGLVHQYHDKVFAAFHEQRQRFANDEQVFAWAEKAGLERAKFIDVYRSFGVQTRVRRADALMAAYKIQSWPTIAIDGRYLTSPWQASLQGGKGESEAQQQQMALTVMDVLVARARAEKK